MTLEERYEKWRSSPEGKIYPDGRPIVFTVEEWEQYKKLSEDRMKVQAEGLRKTQEPETEKRQARTTARSTRRKHDIEKSLRPGSWQVSLDVKGLKKDFDRFNADLPHLIESATLAYGLTDLKVKRRRE
jgi:hypothetical protein